MLALQDFPPEPPELLSIETFNKKCSLFAKIRPSEQFLDLELALQKYQEQREVFRTARKSAVKLAHSNDSGSRQHLRSLQDKARRAARSAARLRCVVAYRLFVWKARHPWESRGRMVTSLQQMLDRSPLRAAAGQGNAGEVSRPILIPAPQRDGRTDTAVTSQDRLKWQVPFLPNLSGPLMLSEGDDFPPLEMQLAWAGLLQAYKLQTNRYGRTFAEGDFRDAADTFHRLDQSLKSWRKAQSLRALGVLQTPSLRELEGRIAAARALITSGEAFFLQRKASNW